MALGQSALTVKCTVRGFKGSKVYLSAINGGKANGVDSAKVIQGKFSFNPSKQMEIGMYRISFNDSVYTDIIINGEEVVLDFDYNNIILSMKVLNSDENKVFYSYLQYSIQKDIDSEPAMELGKRLYKEGVAKNKKQLDSLKTILDSLNVKQQIFTNNLIKDNQKLFASRIIKTLQLPSYTYYKAHADTIKYKSENAFLRDHFFDNIDFNDTLLLRTAYIYQACSDYLTSYAKPQNNETYTKACDIILSKAKVNKTSYDYVLNLLIQTFESSDWEMVFVYLTEKYYLENACTSDQNTKSIAEKAEAIKKLAIGKQAPELNLQDLAGAKINLYDLKKEYTLILFWASFCTHCEELLPQLKPQIKNYITSGKLSVYAVAMDLDKTSWQKATQKLSNQWIHVSDLEGFSGATALSYNVWRTPSFYILDKDKKIIARPYSGPQVITKLKELIK